MAMPMLENEIDELAARVRMVEFVLMVFVGNSFAQMSVEDSDQYKRDFIAEFEKRPPAATQAMLDNRRYSQIATRSVEMAKEFMAQAALGEAGVRAALKE